MINVRNVKQNCGDQLTFLFRNSIGAKRYTCHYRTGLFPFADPKLNKTYVPLECLSIMFSSLVDKNESFNT